MKWEVPVALTIAGSDSGGGAGIEADLKTFSALGVHGTAAITSITAQNTYEVRAVYDLPPDMVSKQIEAVADDMGVDAAKTGMLSNEDIIKAVASTVRKYGFPLVVDPVMIAKSGAPLLRPEAMDALIKHVVPLAKVITPNLMEAEKLASMKIETVDDMKVAAKKIVEELGAESALVKGGHLKGLDVAIDVLYYNGRYYTYTAPRIINGCTHGTGCSFSAAIAAELAKGKNLVNAIEVAKNFIVYAIKYGLKVGRGYCPVNPISWMEIKAEKYEVISQLKEAVKTIEERGEKIAPYTPETQINIVMSLPRRYARGVDDVAGVLGRIVRYGNKVKAVGPITFGASKHMARAVLKIMEYDPNVRSAMNIKYDKEVVETAKKLGYKVSFYDRREEPEDVKRVEGASIPWGVETAVKRLGEVPDIIYHLGDWGKEPMINIFGGTPKEVVDKLLRIIKTIESSKYQQIHDKYR